VTELLTAQRPLLEDEIDQELVCTGILQVTHDVKTFVLHSPDPRYFEFRAGQYLTIIVDVGGHRLERCYTISSPSTRPDLLTITVKRVPGGPVSNWLHDRLSVGDRVWVSGPFGRFTLDDHPARKHLFLSAGSGITPLMSMTRTMHDLADPYDVVFVHSARTPADIVFRDELEALAVAGSGLRVTTVCEADAGDARWWGERGRLNLPMLTGVVSDLHDREVFVCGPPAYMDSVRSLLAEAGVDPARCHEESFLLGGTARPEGDASSNGTAPAGFAVEFRRSGRVVTCDADTNVLDAAAKAGIALPSSCGEGVCGTCKSTLLEGSVDMQHGGGIRPREIARQQILVCCSKPLENLVIDA
jgi:ferredoxin-NADP reductase